MKLTKAQEKRFDELIRVKNGVVEMLYFDKETGKSEWIKAYPQHIKKYFKQHLAKELEREYSRGYEDGKRLIIEDNISKLNIQRKEISKGFKKELPQFMKDMLVLQRKDITEKAKGVSVDLLGMKDMSIVQVVKETHKQILKAIK